MLIRLPLDSEFYTEEGRLKDEFKYRINVDELKIRDSKIIGKPEDLHCWTRQCPADNSF